MKKVIPIIIVCCFMLSCSSFSGKSDSKWENVVVGDWYNYGHTLEYSTNTQRPTKIPTHFEIAFTKDFMYIFNPKLSGLSTVANYKVSGNQMYFIGEESKDTISIYNIKGSPNEFRITNREKSMKFKKIDGSNTLTEYLEKRIDSVTYYTAIRSRMENLKE